MSVSVSSCALETHSAALPLVVDVDRGLCAENPIAAGLRHSAARHPGATLAALWQAAGRRDLALARLLDRPGAVLPRLWLRCAALDLMDNWRRFGAPVVLISALPEQSLAHLRDVICPEAVLFGARAGRALSARGKADLLAQVYGGGGFDLVAHGPSAQVFAPLARRAMLTGLKGQQRRSLLVDGVHASALVDTGLRPVLLRGGPGWAEQWDGLEAAMGEARQAVRPERHPPNQDVSDAGHSQTGKAARF
ncbi:MAG: hypothetical protein OIF40_01810 [Mangrovicoccus sp.]|nr:hypothetical protein [Mangrovicoccus sp.]